VANVAEILIIIFCRMSGDSAADAAAEAKLTGLSKHFNGVTMRGRANVSLLCYDKGCRDK
jgi:hypothetical protein